MKEKPSGYSYRVAERVWAGEYPVWEWNSHMRERQLALYTNFGINRFLDLTERGEMPPYEPFLPPHAVRISFPLPDEGVPSDVRSVVRLFRELGRLPEDARLYIHCVGGVGRTGTIVACWFVCFAGLSAGDALAEMRHRFAFHGRSAWMSAPETQRQIDFVGEFAKTYHQWGSC